jgi:DNA-binding HxlR family transcriptional regulator
MSRKRFTDMNCPAARALEEIGDWWTLLIVREAFYGTATFSEFQERLGIAKNILTDRLNALVESGVMAREQTRPEVERYTYALTDKGRDILPILVALMQWGVRWVFGEKRRPLQILDSKDKAPIARIAVTARDGRMLQIEDLRFRAGPGATPETLNRFAAARTAEGGKSKS